MDFAGPINGKMVLVLVDAHSKWIEASWTPDATSATVIEEQREQFARFGIPETLVINNRTCFVSEEFETFLRANGIHHLTSVPYNGLAERPVQIIKKGLKKNRVHPYLSGRVESKQQAQKKQHESKSRDRIFAIGSKVWVHNTQRGDK